MNQYEVEQTPLGKALSAILEAYNADLVARGGSPVSLDIDPPGKPPTPPPPPPNNNG